MGLSKGNLASAAVGAAVSAAIVIGLYEGSSRAEREAAPVALETAGAAPTPADSAPHTGPDEKSRADLASLLGAPPADATREDLLRRDEALRRELGRVRGRARAAGEDVDVETAGRPGEMPGFLDLSEAELRAMAENCEVRFDAPPLDVPPRQLGGAYARDLDASEEEREALQRTIEAFRTEVLGRIRALYVEATGDASGVAQLSVQSMGQEILDKSAPGETAELRRRLAWERAGLASPPTNLSDASPTERYFRLMAGLGDRFENALAEALDRERARSLRGRRGGWGSRHAYRGCPEGGE